MENIHGIGPAYHFHHILSHIGPLLKIEQKRNNPRVTTNPIEGAQ